jgi:hypothetical protein
MSGRVFATTALAVALCGPAIAAGGTTTHLSYAIYARGFRAMVLNADLVLDNASYQVSISDHTVGFIGALVSNRVASTSTGTFTGSTVHPEHYQSAGYSRGADRRTEIEYDGARPRVVVLSPVEPKRDVVPAGETIGTVDTLSPVASLMREIVTTDRCDGTFNVYDGARLTRIVATTAGNETLPKVDRSPYAGAALHCDFTTQVIAGFLHDDNYARSHEVQHGTAWVARVVPGGPPVPIRVQFTTPDHGSILIYLQTATVQGT